MKDKDRGTLRKRLRSGSFYFLLELKVKMKVRYISHRKIVQSEII